MTKRSVCEAFGVGAISLLFSNCSGPYSAAVNDWTSRDSAGIEIRESVRAAWDSQEAWSVQPSPLLVIGEANAGDAAYEFFRIDGVTRLWDGRIAVTNSGTSEIRVYDGAGLHVASYGRRGEGPGEFQWLRGLWTQADTLVVFDQVLLRISVYGPDGRLHRTVPIGRTDELGRPHVSGVFSDGSFLVMHAPIAPAPMEARGRIPGESWPMSRYSPAGAFVNEITSERESPRWGHAIPGLPAVPYLPMTLGLFPVAAHDRDLYIGEGSRFEVRRFRSDGTLVQIVRWNAPLRPVLRADVQRLESRLIERRPNGIEPAAFRAFFREVEVPDSMPAYDRLLLDSSGNLWVRYYSPPWESAAPWSVLRDGRWLGDLSLPRNLEVYQIGDDFVLGVQRDELGVERVVLLKLLKP